MILGKVHVWAEKNGRDTVELRLESGGRNRTWHLGFQAGGPTTRLDPHGQGDVTKYLRLVTQYLRLVTQYLRQVPQNLRLVPQNLRLVSQNLRLVT